jgi:hypothetical protein
MHEMKMKMKWKAKRDATLKAINAGLWLEWVGENHRRGADWCS